MTTSHYCWYRNMLVIYIWWHDQKCSRCWLFLNVQIPVHHRYHIFIPLFLHWKQISRDAAFWVHDAKHSLGFELFSLYLFSKAEEQQLSHGATWEILYYFCHSLHIIHIFTSIIQTQRDSKGRNLPYRVAFSKYMLCHVTFYNQSQGNVLIT